MAVDKADTPLEDLMVAMDVVDTLRHEDAMVTRELDSEGRRERLLKRLRDMYSAQGIDVPDRVLKEGIAALEQKRFEYQAVQPSWRTRLAHMWVSRGRWGKPLIFLALVGSVFLGVYFFKEVLPEQQMRSNLPQQIDASVAAVIAKANNPLVVEKAIQMADQARSSLAQNALDDAQAGASKLQEMQFRLNQTYQIRIVSGANQNSGIWRRPPNNSGGRNYYLIVEAIDANNNVVAVEVVNEENNEQSKVKIWGLRVSEQTFHAVAADKRDDGIIQSNVVGEKKLGFLAHDYLLETSGATITEW